MKRPMGLLIFGIMAIVTNLVSIAVFFMMFIMPAQAFSYLIPLISTIVLFLLLLIISSIGMFQLRKWGYNIFVTVTLILHLLLAFYLLVFPGVNIIIIIFLSCFMVYFLKPSTRKLFK